MSDDFSTFLGPRISEVLLPAFISVLLDSRHHIDRMLSVHSCYSVCWYLCMKYTSFKLK